MESGKHVIERGGSLLPGKQNHEIKVSSLKRLTERPRANAVEERSAIAVSQESQATRGGANRPEKNNFVSRNRG